MLFRRALGTLVSLLSVVACSDALPPEQMEWQCPLCIASTTSGSVEGKLEREVYAFKGIPFAAAERWTPARAPRPWTTTLDAKNLGSPCPQVDAKGVYVGDEDCLRLNVWSARSSAHQANLPVLVFLHGGGNVSGSNADPLLDGARLAARGAVVVVPNYRLGALGYLAHPELTLESATQSSGNYGLSDLLLALQWVQQNIQSFGGSRDKVLVFGQSAGSRSLCALAASPLAEGLIDAAVLLSGTCDLDALNAGHALGERYAELAGCSAAPRVTDCLRALSAEAATRLFPSFPTNLGSSEYNPRIDGWLILRDPLEAFAAGESQVGTIMIGSNSHEVSPIVSENEGHHYEQYLALHFGSVLAQKLLELYPRGAYASGRDAIIALLTEGRYFCPLRRTAQIFGAAGVRTYRYLFARGVPSGPLAELGAFHGLELAFLFENFSTIDYVPTSEDRDLTHHMQLAWHGLAEAADPGFAPYQPDSVYRVLDLPLRQESDAVHTRCDFWDSLRQR